MAITKVSSSLIDANLTITGGTVDDTVIGSGTPAAGTFTTIGGTLASSVTGTTQSAGDNSTKIATTGYVETALANMVDSAPSTLDTLNELAAALGDDPNFATTVTNSIALKAPLANPTFTGSFTSPGIDDNANAIAITIDSSENVGIGVTSPSNYYSDNLVVAAADESGITLVSDPAHQAYVMFADGTSGSQAYRGYFGYDHGSDFLNIVSSGTVRFYSDDPSTEAMRIDANGNLLVGQTSANSNATGIGALPYGSLYSCRDGGAPFLANRKSSDGAMVDRMFLEVLAESWSAYQASEGAFDPTIKPLVAYWGFGPEKFTHPEQADSAQIAELLNLVQFDSLSFAEAPIGDQLSEMFISGKYPDSLFLNKPDSMMEIDFNAVGQGWSVDKVAELLESLDIDRYFIEIGGEIKAGRPKPSGEYWKFGVDKPEPDLAKRELQAIVSLRSRGLATNGNYRKFYERNGIRYAHTIDPSTGFPTNHSLLSATVVAPTAAEADAMATAYMVMGKDSAVDFLADKEYLSNYIYLIYDSAGVLKTYTSEGLKNMIDQDL